MRIEVLFPEICNLYGDLANIRYLRECLPEAEIIKTTLQRRPTFIEEPVDLVYMGTTTEKGQVLALEQLRFYREEILKQVETGTNFLITGNAMELFADSIEEDGQEVCRGLGLYDGIVRRSSINRFNSLFLGDFHPEGQQQSPIRIVGYKSQFGHTYGKHSDQDLDPLALFHPDRGPGMNRYAAGEGIRIQNFYATYVIGPLLILNPPFTKWYIRNRLGYPIEKLAYEEAAMDSYRCRVEEYQNPQTGLYYWGGTTERWT